MMYNFKNISKTFKEYNQHKYMLLFNIVEEIQVCYRNGNTLYRVLPEGISVKVNPLDYYGCVARNLDLELACVMVN